MEYNIIFQDGHHFFIVDNFVMLYVVTLTLYRVDA